MDTELSDRLNSFSQLLTCHNLWTIETIKDQEAIINGGGVLEKL